MELWDVYTKDRIKTGETMVRGEPIAPGDYHVVVHACMFNTKGELLIQQRQSFKSGFPNLWDISVGGSAVTGDTSQMAVERELMEELGISMDFSQVRPHLTINFDRGFDDIYLVERDVDIASLTLQYEEVQQAKWASLDEILAMMDAGDFIPYHKHLMHLFFDMRHLYGAFHG